MQKDRAAGKSIPREEMKKKMGMKMKFVTIDCEGKISFPDEKKKKPVACDVHTILPNYYLTSDRKLSLHRSFSV